MNIETKELNFSAFQNLFFTTLLSSSGSQENCLNPEVVEQICRRNPILRYSHHPLHSPLLPLPYGDAHFSCESDAFRTSAAAAGFRIDL